MTTLDWLAIAAYFSILLGIAWWVILRGKDTTDDYFLAGRNLGWFVVGASIFASNIGSEHIVGLAGSGQPAALRLPTMSFTPGVCWFSAGSSSRFMCDRESLRCQNFWR